MKSFNRKRLAFRHRLSCIAAASTALAGMGSAYGTSNTADTFNGTTSLAFDTATNWSTGYVPDTSGTIINDAIISNAYPTSGGKNFTLSTNETFGSLNDVNTDGYYQYLENGSSTNTSTNTLTLGAGTNGYAPAATDMLYVGPSSYLDILAGGSTYGILNVALGETGTMNVGGSGIGIIGGILSGAHQFTKTGPGTLALLNANNTFGAANLASSAVTPVTISAGILQVISGGSLGSAPSSTATAPDVIFSGNSTLQLYAANSSSGASEPFGSTRNFQISSGVTATFDSGISAASTFNIGGGIIGSGSLLKISAGTLQLDGTCTYTGSTTITGGTIALNTAGAITNPTAALNLNGGTLSVLAGHTLDQSFATTAIQPGSSSITAGNFSSASLYLALGAISRSTGGVVDFTAFPTTGSITTTTANAGANASILGGYATALGETTWAVSGGNGTTAGAVSALSSFDTGFATTGANVDVTGASNVTTPVTAINSLRFNTASGFTVTPSGTLTIATGGILETTNVGSNYNYINTGNLTTGGSDLVVIQNNTSALLYIGSTITDAISGSIGLTKAGAGILALTAANTFTGPTYVTAGTLSLQNTYALQYSTLASGAPTFDQSVSSNTFYIGGLATSSAIALINNNSAAISLIVGGNNASTSFLNIFTGAGSLTKIGTGTLSLTYNPNSTFTGGFNISSGIVAFAAGGSFGAASNVVTIQNGATIAYNGAGAATWGTTRSLTLAGGIDTIQIGSVTTASNTSTSALNIGVVGGSGTGILAGPSTGTSELDKTGLGTLTINSNSTYNGGTIATEGTLVAMSANSLGVSTVPSDSGSGPLSIIPSILFATVDIESSTAGVSSLTNYVSGVPAAGTASLVLGSPVINGSTVLTIGTDGTSTTYSGSISDRTSNYSGAAGSIVKVGSGTLTLSGSNSFTGGTNVSSGTLVLSGSNALPTDTALNIASGAEVSIANHGSGAIAVVQASALTNSGVMDITNNDLVLKGAGATGLTTAFNEIQAGYNGGAWNGTSSTAGVITSSTAASNTSYLTAVGLATGLTSFEGLTVSTSDVLIKYTYYGDTNLDGGVDGSDYTNIDNGFNSHLTGWQNGDFNYDGVVDGSDYTLIDNAYNTQGASLGTNPADLIASNTAQIAGGSAAVPEPTTLGLLGMGAMGMLSRRRRKEFRGQ
jgi:autotransporter-associated beta strand protein